MIKSTLIKCYFCTVYKLIKISKSFKHLDIQWILLILRNDSSSSLNFKLWNLTNASFICEIFFKKISSITKGATKKEIDNKKCSI